MAPSSVDELRTLLADTSLEDLAGPDKQLICILKDTATVEQALKTLAARRILSAPVVSAETSDVDSLGAHWSQDRPLEGDSQIQGFVDVKDILSSFLAVLEPTDIKKMKMLALMRLLEQKGQAFSCTAIKDLKVFGGDGDFFHVSQTKTSLREVIMYGLLHPRERGMHGGRHANHVVHRVAVFDSQSKIRNIISQTDICRFLSLNRQALGALGEQSVRECGWVTHSVVTVTPEMSTIEAMSLMHEKSISAVAVVDGAGKLIGNFSVSEMRTIMAEHFGALALPVGEFLALEHGTEFVGYTRIQEAEVVATASHKFVTDRVARVRPRTPGEEVGQSLVLVGPDTMFTQVIQAITSHKIHRVYVMDESEKPVGVVTCTDVLRKVLEATDP